MYYLHDHLSVCLSVCLLTILPKYYWLKLYEKSQKMYLGPTQIPINVETELDHLLDSKTNPDFPIYLLLQALAEICSPRVLLFT